MPLSTSRWAIRSDNSTIIQLHIMKKLVIFDLDGTLLNTITDLGMAANYALKKNGFAEHDIERYPFFVGNGVRKLIERVLPPATGNEKTIERMLVDFKEYYNCHNTAIDLERKRRRKYLCRHRGLEVRYALDCHPNPRRQSSWHWHSCRFLLSWKIQSSCERWQ